MTRQPSCATFSSSRWPLLPLASDLLKFEDDELGGLQWREADLDVYAAVVDVILSRAPGIALDVKALGGRAAVERTVAPQVHHEHLHIASNPGPQTLVVGLEDRPLRAAIERFLDVKREAAHRDVLPVR